MRFVEVADVSDVPENGNKAFAVEGRSILICRVGAGIFAVENRCTHNSSELEGGRIRGHFLFCPVHGARYDLRDGSTAGALTKMPLCTFEVRESGGKIAIGLAE
jgi:3-phenylpropionate/trans-cinnamate dioxygenase ferredoxin subunit